MAESEPNIFNTALDLYYEGKFREGYTLITEHAAEFPDYLDESFYYRICLIAKAGEVDMAEEILEDALDQGYFFSEATLRKDEDLAALQGRSFFERLVSRDLQMVNDAQRNSKPLLQILRQDHPVRDGRKRFLMALHGNSQNFSRFLPIWDFIPQTDWLTAIPQSSQVGGSHQYVWTNQDVGLREIKEHYRIVLKHYEPDPLLSLICGFSMGGGLALRAALEQAFPISAFLLVCPYFGELDAWLPMIETAQGKGLRGYFLLGEKDEPITEKAKAMQNLLEEHGIHAGVEVIKGLRHDFPSDFEAVFKKITEELFPA